MFEFCGGVLAGIIIAYVAIVIYMLIDEGK